MVGEMVLFQRLHNLFAKGILADCAHGHAFKAELGCVIREVCGCSAKFLAFREHVPKGFANAYYVFIHNYLLTFER